MLKAAGPKGIRSDAFFAAHLPRAAARINELKNEGIQINTRHEHPFVVYVYAGSVGIGAGDADTSVAPCPDSGSSPEASHTSSPCVSGEARLFPDDPPKGPLNAFTDAEAA
jgi:hypothetical protein